MKCVIYQILMLLLVLGAISHASPVQSSQASNTQEDEGAYTEIGIEERENRQMKGGGAMGVAPPPDVKSIGAQIATGIAQTAAAQFPYPGNLQNLQLGRYGGLSLGFGYPSGFLGNSGYQQQIGAGTGIAAGGMPFANIPGIGMAGGFNTGTNGLTGVGPGVLPFSAAMNSEMYAGAGGLGYGGDATGFLPNGGQIPNNNFINTQNPQNLNSLVNLSNLQGFNPQLQAVEQQQQLQQLQAQQSQLQPQYASYPYTMPGFFNGLQMGYSPAFASYQG